MKNKSLSFLEKLIVFSLLLAMLIPLANLTPKTVEPYITEKEFRTDTNNGITKFLVTFQYETPVTETEHKIDLVVTKEDGSEIVKSVIDKPVSKHNEKTAIFHFNMDELPSTKNVKLDLKISYKDHEVYKKTQPLYN